MVLAPSAEEKGLAGIIHHVLAVNAVGKCVQVRLKTRVSAGFSDRLKYGRKLSMRCVVHLPVDFLALLVHADSASSLFTRDDS